MGSAPAQAIDRDHAATAGYVNAQARNRGLIRPPVRALLKVRCVALLFALAHKLLRAVAPAPRLPRLSRTPSAVPAASTAKRGRKWLPMTPSRAA